MIFRDIGIDSEIRSFIDRIPAQQKINLKVFLIKEYHSLYKKVQKENVLVETQDRKYKIFICSKRELEILFRNIF